MLNAGKKYDLGLRNITCFRETEVKMILFSIEEQIQRCKTYLRNLKENSPRSLYLRLKTCTTQF